MPGTRRVPKKKDCREKEEQGEGLRFRMRKIFFCVDVRKKVEKTNNMEINNCVPGRFLYFCSQEKWLARLRRRTRTRTEEAIPLPLPLLRLSGVFLIIIWRKNGEAITKALPSLDAQTTTRLNSTARNHRKRTRTDRAGKDAATTEIRTTGRSL